MKPTRNQWINAILITVCVSVTPFVGLLGPFQDGNLSGQSTGELFQLAGYAFSIWAVIYSGLFALGIWQGLATQADNVRARRAAPWLSATALGNIVWIFLASSPFAIPWTVPVLVFMGITGWIAYFRLHVGNPDLPAVERRLHIPLQIYVGWLSVATVANTAAVLSALGWNGWGISPVTWTIIMLVVAVGVAWIVGRLVNDDNIYRAVFVWAFVALFVEQQEYPLVAWSALVAAAVVLAMIAVTWPRARRSVLTTAEA